MYCVIMLLLAGVVLEVDSKKGDLHLDITVLLSPKMLSRLASAIAKAGETNTTLTLHFNNYNNKDNNISAMTAGKCCAIVVLCRQDRT